MPTRRRAEPFLALLVLVAAVVIVLTGRHESHPSTAVPVSWRGLVGDPRPRVSVGQRSIVVLRAPSVAQRVAARGLATEAVERRWTSQAYAAQQQVLTMLAEHGLGVHPDYEYARVLDGFAATLDPRALALLEDDPDVAGIYPVRAAFPAALSTAAASGAGAAGGAGVSLPGFDGRGVTVALLDTGVQRSHPYLHGRVLAGIDIVGATASASAQANPQDPARREQHGTELAGVIVGSGGPDGLHGVAGGATLLPIRVAGWQPDVDGNDVVYARSDQLIAGLERAVDPNGDGDTHDAARVAVIGVAEPYAAFAAGPEAQAVAGALALDTLVVSPAGNDGPAGPSFGSIAGPGGAPAALTVGATDERASVPTARLVLRRGLQVVYNGTRPLLGATSPSGAHDLGVGTAKGPADDPASFFDRRGLSLVAGRAAVVPSGVDPAGVAAAAARAGARAVLLFGPRAPAGPLALTSDPGVPVLPIPGRLAAELLAARRAGEDVGVSLAPGASRVRSGGGGLAAFSSRGLAFDGGTKPNLAAPGVGLETSAAGVGAEAAPSFAVVNGTSAAAAATGAAAALLAQARPGLDASELGSLLAGYTRPLAAAPTDAGTGSLDVGASAVGEVAASSTAVDFGRWTGSRWRATRTLELSNVSTRRLHLGVTVSARGGSAGLRFAIRPGRLVLGPGRHVRVRITARAPARPQTAFVAGVVAVAPAGGEVLRIPWAVDFSPPTTLLGRVALNRSAFAPSDEAPAVLEVRAGRVTGAGTPEIEPVARLDVLLYEANGTFVGPLARLRDLLPGTYSFGITGRGPHGSKLAAGSYELRLVATSTLGGPPSRVRVRFRIE